MTDDFIKKEFKKITGLELSERQTNFIEENLERKDMIFEQISRLAFDSPRKLNRLKKALKVWLVKERNSETLWVLAGVVHYCSEDFQKAAKCFRQAIFINSQNLDNWVDLAFALRHLNQIEASNKIFFNLERLIKQYA